MENINRLKLNKYSQIYDYLKTTRLTEFLSDKRNELHNELFNNAVSELINDVNGEQLSDLSIKIAQNIAKYDIPQLNVKDFQIVEFKNKIWYEPSNILIIYTKELVVDGCNYRRLRFGPYSLKNYWHNDYILKRNIENIVNSSITPMYAIEYIDYVKGTVTIYDRMNDKRIAIDIDYINPDTKIADDYKDRMFTKMRNINFI